MSLINLNKPFAGVQQRTKRDRVQREKAPPMRRRGGALLSLWLLLYLGHCSSSIRSPRFTPLPLRELKTGGWLQRQMDLAAQGLAGNEHLIWPWLRCVQLSCFSASLQCIFTVHLYACAAFSRDSQFIGRCQSKQPTHTRNMSQCEGWQFST